LFVVAAEYIMFFHLSWKHCPGLRIFIVATSVSLVMANGKSPAATFSSVGKDGHIKSAEVDFAASGDIMTVTLTNTTPNTEKVQDLLTGVSFQLLGFTPTLLSVTGLSRTVNKDGTFADSAISQDLSWSLKSLGDEQWRLDSHPNAEDSIIGPATNGSYESASGAIAGNPGHNPFAAETIIATLQVPGLSSASGPLVRVVDFGFSGSNANALIIPGGGLEIPEPATATLVGLIAGIFYVRPRSR
jgi:hypothetical protein